VYLRRTSRVPGGAGANPVAGQSGRCHAPYSHRQGSAGFKLDRHPRLLAQFVAYLEEAGAGTVTTRLAPARAAIPSGTSPGLAPSPVFGCSAWWHTWRPFDPCTQVPATDLLSRAAQRGQARGGVPVDLSSSESCHKPAIRTAAHGPHTAVLPRRQQGDELHSGHAGATALLAVSSSSKLVKVGLYCLGDPGAARRVPGACP
jgi:hypothetical protein